MNRNKDQIRALRQSYEKGVLTISEIDKNPFSQFNNWFEHALSAEIFEANAMTLATCGNDGQPSARTVLLKEIEPDGFIFYTNYNSKKGIQISQNNKASILLFWKELERQIRIEGQVTQISRAHSEEYFHSRPKGSQIGAWASPQSDIISREDLEAKKGRLEEQHAEEESLPLPPFWGGYKLKPHYFEFWQGRQNRLHDRISYSLTNTQEWAIDRIAP